MGNLVKIQNCPATVTGVFVWQVFHKEMQERRTKPECRLFFEIRKDLRGMDRIFPITFIVEILIYLAFLINEVAA